MYPTACSPQVWSSSPPPSWPPSPICPPPPPFQEIILSKSNHYISHTSLTFGKRARKTCFLCFPTLWSSVPVDQASLWEGVFILNWRAREVVLCPARHLFLCSLLQAVEVQEHCAVSACYWQHIALILLMVQYHFLSVSRSLVRIMVIVNSSSSFFLSVLHLMTIRRPMVLRY